MCKEELKEVTEPHLHRPVSGSPLSTYIHIHYCELCTHTQAYTSGLMQYVPNLEKSYCQQFLENSPLTGIIRDLPTTVNSFILHITSVRIHSNMM